MSTLVTVAKECINNPRLSYWAVFFLLLAHAVNYCLAQNDWLEQYFARGEIFAFLLPWVNLLLDFSQYFALPAGLVFLALYIVLSFLSDCILQCDCSICSDLHEKLFLTPSRTGNPTFTWYIGHIYGISIRLLLISLVVLLFYGLVAPSSIDILAQFSSEDYVILIMNLIGMIVYAFLSIACIKKVFVDFPKSDYFNYSIKRGPHDQ